MFARGLGVGVQRTHTKTICTLAQLATTVMMVMDSWAWLALGPPARSSARHNFEKIRTVLFTSQQADDAMVAVLAALPPSISSMSVLSSMGRGHDTGKASSIVGFLARRKVHTWRPTRRAIWSKANRALADGLCLPSRHPSTSRTK